MNTSEMIKGFSFKVLLMLMSVSVFGQSGKVNEGTVHDRSGKKELKQTNENLKNTSVTPIEQVEAKKSYRLNDNLQGKEVLDKDGAPLKSNGLLNPMNLNNIKRPEPEKPVIVTKKDCLVT